MEKITSRRIHQFTDPSERLGAVLLPEGGAHIRLWAPDKKSAEIEWIGKQGRAPLQRSDDGYFTGYFPQVKEGDTYYFHCDGTRIPDPASRYQPEGVFGPSAVTAREYAWTDHGWPGVPMEEWVLYEIHPGTFSQTHDFDGIIKDLPRLKALGITTLEIMPVSQFSGERNWGYDGVFPHAVQNSYGGPEKLKALVDACHSHGLAVMLDVVYNHIGPEGNILFSLGPYIQTKYHTPWGEALNYDGEYSDEVRRYFLQTVWQWLTEFHFDGLRLDAVQTILDTSPITFLQEAALLKEKAEGVTGRKLVLIAETDMNDSRLLEPVSRNGTGFDGHWADDLHHALHATLADEKTGYYEDYGGAAQIAKIFERGVAYEGDYSPFRKRLHGRSYENIDKRRLVVETQNHDQIGNRLMGERLMTLAGEEKAKLGAACVLLSPFMPFIFMGEEWGSGDPFLYFISHSDPDLLEAIKKGRRDEWKSFDWKVEPPDPAADETFEKCVLKIPSSPQAEAFQDYYKTLIGLSKQVRAMQLAVDYNAENEHIILNYKKQDQEILAILSFHHQSRSFSMPAGTNWEAVLPRPAGMLTSVVTIEPYSAHVFKRAA